MSERKGNSNVPIWDEDAIREIVDWVWERGGASLSAGDVEMLAAFAWDTLESDAPMYRASVSEVAVEMGRRGGKKGGKARAKKLTPEERSEIARKAARARWGKREGPE